MKSEREAVLRNYNCARLKPTLGSARETLSQVPSKQGSRATIYFLRRQPWCPPFVLISSGAILKLIGETGQEVDSRLLINGTRGRSLTERAARIRLSLVSCERV